MRKININYLKNIVINITKLAQEGKLDPVIGRHEEIRRVIQIFPAVQKIIRY